MSRARILALLAAVTFLSAGCATSEWAWSKVSFPGRATSTPPAADATARLMPQRALVDFATGWIAENR